MKDQTYSAITRISTQTQCYLNEQQNYKIKLKMSDLRATIMADEDIIASKRRFGLFSQPPPLAVGDDGAYKQRKIKKGQNGKPITKPAQMLSGPCRTGMTKSAYFQVPQSILQKDPYKQTFKIDIQYERKMHSRSKFHENQFKPASGSQTLDKAAYRYKEENPESKRKIIRDEGGKVITQARNFTTNPISKVETQFFKPLKHIPDPYERKKDLEKRQRQEFNKKLPEATYKTMSHGDKPFVKDLLTYGEDAKAKQLLQSRSTRAKTSMNMFPHEAPFKPARRGHGDPLCKFPQHIEKKTAETISPKKSSKQDGGKETWKPNNFGLSRPTPSISLHPKNIKISRHK